MIEYFSLYYNKAITFLKIITTFRTESGVKMTMAFGERKVIGVCFM